MAAGKGTYWANKALDLILGAVAYTPPPNVYFALFNAPPSSSGGGVEVAAAGYIRKQVANNPSEWPAAVNGAKSNANAIIYQSAISDWGVAVAAGIFDQAAGGNLIYFGTFVTAQPIFAGDTAQFPANALTITEA